ncbi:HIT family protein [Paraburkholderia sp. SARCC-3016]|jgi:histidine triad (HIT) family protein|uniref:HIT family protein n=1 Tax=Paraburkholderia sp. SARCC-3016 TaxID=3058611 RepID=UPI002807A8A2|nr:HIT family protein [Paraburkholderia sp. SARCC-3016]MDQ7977041.1 HIT family protein [Paraburkholderia sp. SARCC-3016]
MAYDPQNPFARILRGELPSLRVYEDDVTVALMDIMPQADGHVLVLTKEPVAEIFELSTEGAAACMRTARQVARAVKAALDPPGVMIVQLNGSAAGQTVPHVHFHVIPRHSGLELKLHAAGSADMAQLRDFADRIRAAMPEDE